MSDESKFKEVISTMNAIREKSGVEINGKLYSQVKDRIETFRTMFGSQFGIMTQIDYGEGFRPGAVIVAKCHIIDRETGNIMGSGHAMNYFGADEFLTTSVVEVTETNAIGRALATMGFAGGEFASGSEMQAVPQKREGAAARMSNAEKFVDAVKEAFPGEQPRVNQYQEWYIPLDNSPNEMDKAFMEIDRIEDDKELLAYYYALEKDYFHLLDSEMKNEFLQSFKTRKNQLKG